MRIKLVVKISQFRVLGRMGPMGYCDGACEYIQVCVCTLILTLCTFLFASNTYQLFTLCVRRGGGTSLCTVHEAGTPFYKALH